MSSLPLFVDKKSPILAKDLIDKIVNHRRKMRFPVDGVIKRHVSSREIHDRVVLEKYFEGPTWKYLFT